MATPGCKDIVLTSVEARKDGEFLGYVSRVFGSGAYVRCRIVQNWKPRFTTLKAGAVRRSANTSSICDLDDGRRFCTKTDGITFHAVAYQ